MRKSTASVSLKIGNILVFVMTTDCVFCEIESEFLCIVYIKLKLRCFVVHVLLISTLSGSVSHTHKI